MLAEAFAAVVAAFEEGPRLQPLWAAVVPPEPQPEGYATGIPVGPHFSASFAFGVFKWGPVVAEPPTFDSCEDGFHKVHGSARPCLRSDVEHRRHDGQLGLLLPSP